MAYIYKTILRYCLKKVVADLKNIYGAVTLEEAEKNLQVFAETWRNPPSRKINVEMR